jgi:palmitoyltransferase
MSFSSCSSLFVAIVGYFNYRYFVNFLIYIFIGMLYGSYMLVQPFLNLQSHMYKEQVYLERHALPGTVVARIAPYVSRRDEKMLITLSFMLCIALLCSILCLGGFHIYLTLTAQTTIEFHANWVNRRRARSNGDKPWRNPYDLGWRQNWQQVYGRMQHGGYWWMALLPSRRPPDFLPVPIPGVNTERVRSLLERRATAECNEDTISTRNDNHARPISAPQRTMSV